MAFLNPCFFLLIGLPESAQFGLHQICKLPVGGSIPLASSNNDKRFCGFCPTRRPPPIQLNIQFQNRGRIAAMIVKPGREPRECGESSWPGRADIDHNFLSHVCVDHAEALLAESS
jgi:hypothetical protein